LKELRKIIHSNLKPVLEEVLDSDLILEHDTILQGAKLYFHKAPKGAELPYLIYDIPTISDDGEGFELVTLDIDGWDAPADGDSAPLETFMAAINSKLNKLSIVTDNIVISFYLDSKLVLPDDNPKIIRRKYIYQARLYERS